ncbi:nucleotidyltransferase family protein [Peribacillus sp. SIMBA_075]|uniref:nucleotidyltransferase domain-containing protein n=1 Tax=Peribacillus sp. SIMBA_075 TaxID=3085813 RepID=UPI00397AD62B
MDNNNYSLDLSIIPKELTLLLEILKTENEEMKESFKNESYIDIDWNLFLDLAIHHRVYPLIFSQLKKNENKIPSNVMHTLTKEYKKNAFQMLHLCGEMEQISKHFSENQIHLLFLKGPALAADIYGDISRRTSKDLDVLIAITDLEKAEKLLLSLGYEKEVLPNLLNEWKWRNHHIVFFHPKKKIQLEIHWRLEPLPSKEPPFTELWGRRRVSSATNYPVYVLGKEDLFLYLVSHGARHGWFRLRWLIDIDHMIRRGVDFNRVEILLRKYQSLNIAGQALILTSELLNTPLNDKMKVLVTGNRSKKLSQMALSFINEMKPLNIIMSTNYYRRYLFSLKSSNSRKILRIILLFYPSSADAKTLELPKPLHFLYFPLRPLLWAWRKIRKHKV